MRAETSIIIDDKRRIEADFVFQFRLPGMYKEMYVGELWTADMKIEEIAKRTYKHLLSFHVKAPNKAFDYPLDRRFYILYIFQDEKMMKRIQNRTGKRKKFDHTYQYFLLNTLQNVTDGNFFNGWVNIR